MFDHLKRRDFITLLGGVASLVTDCAMEAWYHSPLHE